MHDVDDVFDCQHGMGGMNPNDVVPKLEHDAMLE